MPAIQDVKETVGKDEGAETGMRGTQAGAAKLKLHKQDLLTADMTGLTRSFGDW